MSLLSKVTANVVKAGTTALKGAKKVAGKAPKMAQKVSIISDDVVKIPGTLNLTTGTKTFKDIGAGIRVVQPGEGTKLGKLGIESVTTYPKDFFTNSEVLHQLQFKGAKKPLPVMNAQELKDFLPLAKELKDAANPLNKAVNAVKNIFNV